jgi:hypothetical protein
MPNDNFNYNNINLQPNSGHLVHDQEIETEYGIYRSIAKPYPKDFFVHLNRKINLAENETIIPVRKFGWKFHVSIDDSEPDNIEKGWNLVKDILIENRVYASKVVAKGHQMVKTIVLQEGLQRGKQITIYTSQHIDRDLQSWVALIRDITVSLTLNEVKPSFRPITDELINGSNYVTFRADGYTDELGNNFGFVDDENWLDGVSHEELAAYRGIMINPPVENQPEVPNWEPPSNCCPFM